MRYAIVTALALIGLVGALREDETGPSYYSTDSALFTTGEKVAGHIGACLVGQSNKPKICFGLKKEFDSDPQFTFLVLFRTGKRDCNPSGGGAEIKSDGVVTTIKEVYELGEFELPLTLETKRDPKTNKISESKVAVGDIEVSGKEPGVVIVDLTAEKPSYTFVKVALPACKVDLADKEHATWTKALDEAIAELKKSSKEIKMLAD